MFKSIESKLILILIVFLVGQGIYYKIKSDRQESKMDDLKIEIRQLKDQKYEIQQKDMDKIVKLIDDKLISAIDDAKAHTEKSLAALNKANEISYNTNVKPEECIEELEKCDEQNSHLRDSISEKDETNKALGVALNSSQEKTKTFENKFNICENQLKGFREEWDEEFGSKNKLERDVIFWRSVAIGTTVAAIITAVVVIFK